MCSATSAGPANGPGDPKLLGMNKEEASAMGIPRTSAIAATPLLRSVIMVPPPRGPMKTQESRSPASRKLDNVVAQPAAQARVPQDKVGSPSQSSPTHSL